MSTPNPDSFWLAFSQAYFALKNEKEYFEKLAQSSVLEEDKVKFFQAAIKMQNLLALLESANQAAIDALKKTELKGPNDKTVEKAQRLAKEFAEKIAASAKAEAIVTFATKFLTAWTALGTEAPV